MLIFLRQRWTATRTYCKDEYRNWLSFFGHAKAACPSTCCRAAESSVSQLTVIRCSHAICGSARRCCPTNVSASAAQLVFVVPEGSLIAPLVPGVPQRGRPYAMASQEAAPSLVKPRLPRFNNLRARWFVPAPEAGSISPPRFCICDLGKTDGDWKAVHRRRHR